MENFHIDNNGSIEGLDTAHFDGGTLKKLKKLKAAVIKDNTEQSSTNEGFFGSSKQ